MQTLEGGSDGSSIWNSVIRVEDADCILIFQLQTLFQSSPGCYANLGNEPEYRSCLCFSVESIVKNLSSTLENVSNFTEKPRT